MKTTTVTCNICGKEIDRGEHGYFDNFISVEKTWGYGTEFDGETHKFDICIDCYKKLTDGFEKPVR